ncbi:MAG: hypothetical protein WDN69_31870 [Aliidongia sp.]
MPARRRLGRLRLLSRTPYLGKVAPHLRRAGLRGDCLLDQR